MKIIWIILSSIFFLIFLLLIILFPTLRSLSLEYFSKFKEELLWVHTMSFISIVTGFVISICVLFASIGNLCEYENTKSNTY